MSEITEKRPATDIKDGVALATHHTVVRELPLTIIVNDEELATLVCSPHELETLAVGFLVSEGLLQNPDDLLEISCREEQGVIWIRTACPFQSGGFLKRNFTSCCGKGRPSLHFINDYNQIQPVASDVTFTAKQVVRYSALLDENSDVFKLTGGVHEAALAHGDSLVIRYEDIGRHNALDRVLGYTFLNRIDTSDKAVVLSGRVASEMLTKAARIGVPLVVSRSAPTSLSIDLADQLGITIAGFTRGNSFNVYTHPERIT